MRREQGYALTFDTSTKKVIAEHSVFSCAHCGTKVHAPTLRSHEFSTCFNCDDGIGRGLICNNPKCHDQCTPFMRRIEAMEAKARFRSMI